MDECQSRPTAEIDTDRVVNIRSSRIESREVGEELRRPRSCRQPPQTIPASHGSCDEVARTGTRNESIQRLTAWEQARPGSDRSTGTRRSGAMDIGHEIDRLTWQQAAKDEQRWQRRNALHRHVIQSSVRPSDSSVTRRPRVEIRVRALASKVDERSRATPGQAARRSMRTKSGANCVPRPTNSLPEAWCPDLDEVMQKSCGASGHRHSPSRHAAPQHEAPSRPRRASATLA